MGGSTLKLAGVGFKGYPTATSQVVLSLGYSHYVALALPRGCTLRARRGTLGVTGSALPRRLVQLRRPDPYKARGIWLGLVKPSTKPGKRR